MAKIIALFVFASLGFFGFYPSDSSSKSFPTTVSPTPTPNATNDLFRIELDRDMFGGECPAGYSCIENCNGEPLVVSVIAKTNSENNSLRYVYTAVYGRIGGEGAKVSWDLKGAQPGTYGIKIDVIDGKSGKLLQSTTKIVTVKECRDDSHRCLECPEFSIDAPNAPVQAGGTMEFTAKGRGGTWSTFGYVWKVSDGKIIEGQGTPTIKVATTRTMSGKTIEATVNFEYDCAESCPNTASASGFISAKRRKRK